MRNLILLLFITTSHSLFAQNIKGLIADAGTHQPLANATISLLKASDSSLLKAALAGDDGHYQFANLQPGNYLLSVQMMGYSPQLIPVTIATTDQTIDIQLMAIVKQLGAVTVRVSRPLVEHRPDKTIFNVENSIVATGNTALELLKMTPTIMIGSNSGIRLKGKEHVMVMLDGKIVPEETLADILQSLSAEQISKIELDYTPSAKFDAAATGGIINIITKKGMGRGFNGVANISALESSYGKYNGGISLNYRTGKLNCYATINGRNSKGYKNETIIRLLDAGNGAHQTMDMPAELFSHGKSATGKMGIDYTINSASTIGFSADGIFTRSNNRVVAISSFINDMQAKDSSLTSNSWPAGNTNYSSYDLYYKNKLNAKGDQLALDLTQMHYNGLTSQMVNTTIVSANAAIPDKYAFSYNSTKAIIDITTAQADYTLVIKQGLSLNTGLKEIFTQSKNQSTSEQQNGLGQEPALNATSYKENIFAGYAMLTRQLKTVQVELGLRAEQTNARLNGTGLNSTYLDLFPSALVSKKLSDKYQASLAYTSRIHRAAYKALIPFVIPIDRYTQEKGNPELKPEYTNSIELTNTIGKINLTIGYTHTRDAIADFIEMDPITRVWTITKGNFPRKENFDVTLVVPITIARWWSTDNTLQAFYNSFVDKTGKVGGVAYKQDQYSCAINSINTFSLPRNIKADLTLLYNSPYIDGLYKLGHSSSVNVGFSKAFLEKKLLLKLAVNDLFHDNGYTFRSGNGNIQLSGDHYTDSRQFVIALSYKFGKSASQSNRTGNDDMKGRLNL
jgi:outer membrane cobalamin receptor